MVEMFIFQNWGSLGLIRHGTPGGAHCDTGNYPEATSDHTLQCTYVGVVAFAGGLNFLVSCERKRKGKEQERKGKGREERKVTKTMQTGRVADPLSGSAVCRAGEQLKTPVVPAGDMYVYGHAPSPSSYMSTQVGTYLAGLGCDNSRTKLTASERDFSPIKPGAPP